MSPEALARRIRKLARVSPDAVVTSVDLARRLLGPRPVVVYDRLASGAQLSQSEDGYRIEVRMDLPDMNFAIAHELGHWAIRVVEGERPENEEELASSVAAALLMPAPVVRSIVEQHGRGFGPIRPLARATATSQTAAHLRLGEVLGDERAVVTAKGRHVLLRTRGAVPWSEVPLTEPEKLDGWRTGDVRIATRRLRGGIDEKRLAVKAT